ncbi:hypothetical protein R80B4_00957 [Fibrobacteres bacterium R8-0-B4]
MSEMIMRWNGTLNPPRFVSDPPGFEAWFDKDRWVSNDGRESAFVNALNGFYVTPDGKLVKYSNADSEFQSDDMTVRVWFDGARDGGVWVINESDTSMFRVLSSVTGQGTVTGAGLHEPGATVTVAATPAQGWTLSSFTRDGVTIGNPATFTMPGNNTAVYAVFIESDSFLLLETGGRLLFEDGGRIII